VDFSVEPVSNLTATSDVHARKLLEEMGLIFID
jgi:hypothetical protein